MRMEAGIISPLALAQNPILSQTLNIEEEGKKKSESCKSVVNQFFLVITQCTISIERRRS